MFHKIILQFKFEANHFFVWIDEDCCMGSQPRYGFNFYALVPPPPYQKNRMMFCFFNTLNIVVLTKHFPYNTVSAWVSPNKCYLR